MEGRKFNRWKRRSASLLAKYPILGHLISKKHSPDLICWWIWHLWSLMHVRYTMNYSWENVYMEKNANSITMIFGARLLRSYPAGFGLAMCRLLPQVVSGSEGCTWPEAHLGPSLRYLRGNRHVNLPRYWLEALPRPLEILNSLQQRQLTQLGQW